ncbi:hypothetical protein TNCV_4440191 [Trichonephila clavipes]|nr:hypothetical protein TNCV_4440191 [Trichonephila clavipes]
MLKKNRKWIFRFVTLSPLKKRFLRKREMRLNHHQLPQSRLNGYKTKEENVWGVEDSEFIEWREDLIVSYKESIKKYSIIFEIQDILFDNFFIAN